MVVASGSTLVPYGWCLLRAESRTLRARSSSWACLPLMAVIRQPSLYLDSQQQLLAGIRMLTPLRFLRTLGPSFLMLGNA